MAYKVLQLITGAYYASGIVAREFETVSGSEASDAVGWLNDILLESRIDMGMVPYETVSTFDAVVGQETYEITDLIDIDTLTFVKDDVRYPVTFVKRDKYQGEGRVLTIDSLPYQYFYERIKGGSKIYLYFYPDQAYTFTINGTFALSSVVINDDLEDTLDRFYITYLRYALADRICTEYNKPTPQGVAKQLQHYRDLIDKNSRPLDMRLRKQSTLGTQESFGFAWANLGRGYLP